MVRRDTIIAVLGTGYWVRGRMCSTFFEIPQKYLTFFFSFINLAFLKFCAGYLAVSAKQNLKVALNGTGPEFTRRLSWWRCEPRPFLHVPRGVFCALMRRCRKSTLCLKPSEYSGAHKHNIQAPQSTTDSAEGPRGGDLGFSGLDEIFSKPFPRRVFEEIRPP